ncbi:MAG: hypothetical protein P1S60_15985, partial [Anaerolineae bacterium]|nr:hypothetical protein [Anaerolineae bacterium]
TIQIPVVIPIEGVRARRGISTAAMRVEVCKYRALTRLTAFHAPAFHAASPRRSRHNRQQ